LSAFQLNDPILYFTEKLTAHFLRTKMIKENNLKKGLSKKEVAGEELVYLNEGKDLS
jgi:hypothetical protein